MRNRAYYFIQDLVEKRHIIYASENNLTFATATLVAIPTPRFHTIVFKFCNHLQSFCFSFVFLNVTVAVFISPSILILKISVSTRLFIFISVDLSTTSITNHF